MQHTSAPWWKFGHVWLVISGPLAVVIASFVTYAIAAHAPDPLWKSEPAIPTPAEGQGASLASSLAPAQQARNHAATGVPSVAARP